MGYGAGHIIMNPSMELAREFNEIAREENQRIESYCKSRDYSLDVVMALKDLRSMHRRNEFHLDMRTPENRLKAMAIDPNNDESYRVNDYGKKHPWKFASLLRMARDKDYFAMIDKLYNDEIVPFLKAKNSPQDKPEPSG